MFISLNSQRVFNSKRVLLFVDRVKTVDKARSVREMMSSILNIMRNLFGFLGTVPRGSFAQEGYLGLKF